MKKHLIAAAVAAAFAVPAMAQVTVSGVLDVTAVGSTKTTTEAAVSTKTNATGANNGWSTSQLVFSGTEDLGGGLKASLVIATTLGDFSATNASFANRDRFVALEGGFGTVRAGRLAPAAAVGFNGYTGAGTTNAAGSLYGLISAGGPGTHAAFGGNLTTETTIVTTSGSGNFERNSNNVQYTSPSINGFVFNANYGRSTSDASNLLGETKTSQQGLHVGYSAGPISVGIAKNTRDVTAQGANATTNGVKLEGDLDWVGGSYNFGVATIGVAHIRRDDSSTDTNGTTVAKNTDLKVNVVGVTVPFGAFTLRGSVYKGDNAKGVATTDDLDLSGHQLSVTYALSKRTLAYAVVGESETKRAGTNTAGATQKFSGNTFGISHSF